MFIVEGERVWSRLTEERGAKFRITDLKSGAVFVLLFVAL
jgi:hypothetical protein